MQIRTLVAASLVFSAGSALLSPGWAQTAQPAASSASAPGASPSAPAQASANAAAASDAMSGTAAWYGRKFNGRKTASGQRFNAAAMTAAHPSLPFGTRVRVTNTANKRSVVVVINDRGPTTPGRMLDVSQAAAKKLGFTRAGTASVTLEVVGRSTQRSTRS